MKNKSIVVKLFLITSTVLIAFLLISLIFQIGFFQKFYENEKAKIVKNNLNVFVEDYKSVENKIELINDFIEYNNSALIISDENGIILHHELYEGDFIIVEDESGNTYKVADDYEEIFYEEGDLIRIKGIKFEDSSFIYPVKVNDDDLVEYEFEEGDKYSKVEISGEIIHRSYTDINTRDINDLLLQYLYDDGDIESSELILEDENITYLIMEDEMEYEGEVLYLYTMISFQTIEEAATIIKSYYKYIFIMIILVILVLSYIYSKLLSRPLVELNEVSHEMSKLNFDVKAKIKSNDELGELGRNLNIMSGKLSNNMHALEDANLKLKDDIKKEKKQDELRKEFVSDMSHELKTPLGVIRSYTEALKDGINEQKRDYYLDVVIDESTKMNEMIVEMLEVYKYEMENLELIKEEINFKQLVEQLSNRFKRSIETKNIKLKVNLVDGVVVADSVSIKRVLENLISNAIRYTEDGGIIRINTKQKTDSIYFYIENSGVNFTDEQTNNIWNRFYRIDKSRSRELGGSGLGLHIVKTILDVHKSDYGVYNTQDGVEFYFSLNKK